MVSSLYQIDFIHPGGTLRLLDFGDMLLAELELKATQAADRYAPIGDAWSESVAKGGASSDLAWGVVRDHASHTAARGYCFSHTAAMPSGITGTLRLTIQGGTTWDLADVTILTTSTTPRVPSATFETISAYAVTSGKMMPITEITLYPGIPYEFILQTWSSLTANWSTY